MNFFTKYKNNIPVVFSLVLLLGIAVTIQTKYDAIMHPQIVFSTETRYILPSSIVKNFSFGLVVYLKTEMLPKNTLFDA